jgi:hypothetical protein
MQTRVKVDSWGVDLRIEQYLTEFLFPEQVKVSGCVEVHLEPASGPAAQHSIRKWRRILAGSNRIRDSYLFFERMGKGGSILILEDDSSMRESNGQDGW